MSSTKRPRKPRAVSSFAPEYLDAWMLVQATGQLDLDFDTPGLAVNFRMRMYQLRRALMLENPEFGQKLYSHDLKVEGSRVVVHVPEWKRALQAKVAEVRGGEALPPLTELEEQLTSAESAPPPTEPEDHLDSTLSNLGFGTKKES